MLRVMDLNEMSFTELVLSIDISSSSGKIALELSKAAKQKVMKTVMLVWFGKYDPVSAPSLVKSERLFRECKLGKDEDPKTSITNLEDLRLNLEIMCLFITDDQFTVQILNSLTNDYKLQKLLLEKWTGRK
jgi:hypothetical protein